MGRRAVDLTGQQFGNWRVLGRSWQSDRTSGNVYWRCKCACGNYLSVRGNNLRGGLSRCCYQCNTRNLLACRSKVATSIRWSD